MECSNVHTIRHGHNLSLSAWLDRILLHLRRCSNYLNHQCGTLHSMRYPLEATQLEDVEVPQLPASRFAVIQPSVQLGRPTSGPTSSRAFCGTTVPSDPDSSSEPIFTYATLPIKRPIRWIEVYVESLWSIPRTQTWAKDYRYPQLIAINHRAILDGIPAYQPNFVPTNVWPCT